MTDTIEDKECTKFEAGLIEHDRCEKCGSLIGQHPRPEDKELVEAVRVALIAAMYGCSPAKVADPQDHFGSIARAVIPIIQKHYGQRQSSSADEIVTDLYRRFKEWSKRGFGADDVTWCEVKADIIELMKVFRQDERERIARKLLADTADKDEARWIERFFQDEYGIDPAKLGEGKP